MRFKELLDTAREKTGGFGGDKLAELADSVNEAMPVITQAGFAVDQLQVTLGLPPKVVLKASVAREISDEEYEALVERLGDKIVASLVAGTFLKAAALQRGFRVGSMHSSQIEIELSPLPAVRLFFAPNGVGAPSKVFDLSSTRQPVATT